MQVLNVDGDTVADEFAALEKNGTTMTFSTCTSNKPTSQVRMVTFRARCEYRRSGWPTAAPDGAQAGRSHCQRRSLDGRQPLKGTVGIPVPTLLYGKHVSRRRNRRIRRTRMRARSLGVLPAKDVMPLALANAQRLAKFSA